MLKGDYESHKKWSFFFHPEDSLLPCGIELQLLNNVYCQSSELTGVVAAEQLNWT